MITDQIIIYQTPDGQTAIDVKLENDSVWLTQSQMQELFNQTKQNISLHINNIFKENELAKSATVKESLTVQKEVSVLLKERSNTTHWMDIPEGVTRRFRAIGNTYLCYHFKKWQLLINELIWSKCCRTNGSAIPKRSDQWLRNVQFTNYAVRIQSSG